MDEREYVFVPDAMKAVAELAFRAAAYGERWIVPTSGPLTLKQAGEIAQWHLGSEIQVRSAGMLTLRLLSFFVRQIRLFLPMAPHYLRPIRYDGGKLRELLGDISVTPYSEGIPQTLDWIARERGRLRTLFAWLDEGGVLTASVTHRKRSADAVDRHPRPEKPAMPRRLQSGKLGTQPGPRANQFARAARSRAHGTCDGPGLFRGSFCAAAVT